MRSVAIIVVALGAWASHASSAAAQAWPLGIYGNDGQPRTWKTHVPDPDRLKCGDGVTPFRFFTSRGAAGTPERPNNRVFIWMPGGGSTSVGRDGELSSPIRNLALLDGRLTPANSPGDRAGPFMDHPDNAEFIGPAHWIALPYCTQDFHSGRRAGAVRYDFTEHEGTLEWDIERRLGPDYDLDDLRADFPSLEVTGSWSGPGHASFEVETIHVSIHHRGALNLDAVTPLLWELMRTEFGVDLDRVELVVAGSSAGGFGTWYNAWRFGDRLLRRPGAKLTLLPMAGAPTERRWDEGKRALARFGDEVADLDHRLDWFGTARPCDVPGGRFPSGRLDRASCDDAIDLTDHYLRRWRGLDLRIAPAVNKEDMLAVRGATERLGTSPDPAAYSQAAKTVCQTVHAYGAELTTRRPVTPYSPWLWEARGQAGVRRVHGFSHAAMLVPMLSPDGSGAANDHGVLRFLNGVAAREPWTLRAEPQLEHQPALVVSPFNPGSPVVATTDAAHDPLVDESVFPPEACNVGPKVELCAGRDTTLPGSGAADRLTGTSRRDVVPARGGADRARGRGGNDWLCGDGGRDRLDGGPGRDRLDGGKGKDRLVGGGGRDRLRGKGGADRIQARGGGRDIVHCGPGRDRARVDRRDRVRACEVVLRP